MNRNPRKFQKKPLKDSLRVNRANRRFKAQILAPCKNFDNNDFRLKNKIKL